MNVCDKAYLTTGILESIHDIEKERNMELETQICKFHITDTDFFGAVPPFTESFNRAEFDYDDFQKSRA